MSEESKLKHLEFIQSVVDRMANNSFLLKGWGVTLVAGLFALAEKDTNPAYALIAYLPVAVFWALDAYYLAQERSYRALYDEVRRRSEAEIDFSLDARAAAGERGSWARAFLSRSLCAFYAPLAAVMLVVLCAID